MAADPDAVAKVCRACRFKQVVRVIGTADGPVHALHLSTECRA